MKNARRLWPRPQDMRSTTEKKVELKSSIETRMDMPNTEPTTACSVYRAFHLLLLMKNKWTFTEVRRASPVGEMRHKPVPTLSPCGNFPPRISKSQAPTPTWKMARTALLRETIGFDTTSSIIVSISRVGFPGLARSMKRQRAQKVLGREDHTLTMTYGDST